MILYTLYENSYIDIAHLESTKGITCYVNSTNRCTCSCTFCLRQTKEMIENNSLWLKEEPTVDEIIQEFEKYDLNDFKEVVFCGFGEPLIRHDDLMKVAKYLKERRPDLPTRVNTNGLSSLYNKRDITPEFKGLLDTVSISLNTSNKEDYLKLTRSQYGIDSFDVKTGEKINESNVKTYTDIFSDKILELGNENKNIVAITAAMPDGTGLKKFGDKYPDKFFDVGIAEEHAVTFAAGLAANGKKPFISIYSSFYQRAYDQIIHDVCLQNLPVTFIVDRAGLVGKDGETHQGIFDISFFSNIPNMTIIAPKNGRELEKALEFAQKYNGPIAIRFSRGKASNVFENLNLIIPHNKKVAIIGKSGSGKTTLIRLIMRLYNYEKGHIYINHKNIIDFNKQSLRKIIGYVGQDSFFFSGSILENINLHHQNSMERVIEVCKMVKIHDFISSLPNTYMSQISENGRNFSAGQKQRLSLARAILLNPKILILDEATSNLDVETELEIDSVLSKLTSQMTVIMIAHRLSTISRCDQILFLENGQLVEHGSHEELLRLNKRYHELWIKREVIK